MLRRDARRGELPRERGAADEQGDVDAGRAKVLGRHHHLLGRLHQEPRQSNGVGLVLVAGGDERLGRDLDAEVDDAVAVVGQDDLDQVLADVVDVALHRGQDERATRRRLGLLHERLEVGHRGLHRLGRLEDFGDDELVVVEEPADLVHALHERAVDDVERRGVTPLLLQVVDEAVAAALDDVAGQPLVK